MIALLLFSKIDMAPSMSALPYIITPSTLVYVIDKNYSNTQDLNQQIAQLKSVIERSFDHYGAVLLRGFSVESEEQFASIIRIFDFDLLNYDFGSTPRSVIKKGVYTSTEYPSHQVIPQHCEQAYCLQWPKKLWFYSHLVAENNGETPIADCQKIYDSIPAQIKNIFEKKGLLYVRNYGNGLDLPWQQAFGTANQEEVSAYCDKNNIGFQWKDDDELRTWQKCQVSIQHPKNHRWTWFNQAHLFHISNLSDSVKETLLSVVDKEDLPRNVYFGDGSEIPDQILDEIRAVIEEHTVSFPWQKSDVMLIDNLRVSHGRNVFSGNRKVFVAMTEPFGAVNLEASSVMPKLNELQPGQFPNSLF